MENAIMRNYRIDNIKFFLIFCVVLGHSMELFNAGGGYRIIYSFHMPAFIFISGYFAQFNRKKIISTLIYPYVLFQCLYLAFDAIIMNRNVELLNFQFTTPYWILWYLLTLILYNMIIPLISNSNFLTLFSISALISLITGLDTSIGYYLSLARFFTFMPYFILGFGWKQINPEALLKSKIFRTINIMAAILSCIMLGKYNFVSNPVLYGSYSYINANYTFITKGILLLCGLNWILLFMWITPAKPIPLVSSIGKNTFVIFLFHGFVIKYMQHLGNIFIYSTFVNTCLAIIISIAIIFSLGNNCIGRIGKFIFTGKGIEAIISFLL